MVRRLVRTMFVVLLAIGALLFATIKSSMWMTRLHVEHLLADFQSIQPMQSNWAEAQHLMHRWGRWGNYQGTCSAVDCSYTIVVMDGLSQLTSRLSENTQGFMANHGLNSAFGKIAWHSTVYSVNFTVQDAVIVRTRTSLMLGVSPHFVSSDWNQGYSLILKTQVHSRLTQPAIQNNNFDRSGGFLRILGPQGTPSDHPDYKVGQPGGCEICMAGELTYTPTLAHNEIVRLTSYNVSCITKWRQCKSLEELLPAASVWHLYPGWGGTNYRPPPDPPTAPCTAAPRALGRDADVAFEADVLSTRTEPHRQFEDWPLYVREVNTVRVRRILKGSPPFAANQQIEVAPYFNSANPSAASYTTEHLHPGTGVILFFQGNFSSDIPPFGTPPCGVIDDAAGNLNAVISGISEDAPTRHGDTSR